MTGWADGKSTKDEKMSDCRDLVRQALAAYRKAIKAACKKADVPIWSPHKLRHSAGTRFAKECGPQAAQVLLGHRTMRSTEIYIQPDQAKAVEAVSCVG